MTTTALPTGALACRACGVATDPASSLPMLVLDVIFQEGKLMRLPLPEGVGPRRPLATVTLSVCPDCAERYRAAERAASSLPRLAVRVGSPLALQLAAALHGLALLGVLQPYPLPETVASALLRHLAAPGMAALWLSRFVPMAARDASPGTCAPEPWAHVPEAVRAELAASYARVCAERVARNAGPVPVPCPDGLACQFCGLAAVPAPAVRVAAAGGPDVYSREVWRPVTTSALALGGRPYPEPVRGYLCKACAEAVAAVGSVGQTSMLRAFITHLRGSGREAEADSLRGEDVRGLVGWGALAARARRRGSGPLPASNLAPWAHVLMVPPGLVEPVRALAPGEVSA